jgi:sugar phosphate isomerase/epimerase
MDIGFLTACLESHTLESAAEWASGHGFGSLEVACWPRTGRDSHGSPSSMIDVASLTPREADDIKALFTKYGLRISSLAYYENNLDRDPEKRARINEHTRACIRAAAMLGVPAVGTFAGRNIDKTIPDNFDEFEAVFGSLVGFAEQLGIQVIIENCVMRGWQKPMEPGTISFTPELWAEMFRRVPNKNFGLNFDPSHLYIQMIDILPAIGQFKDRIFHVHAKDAAIDMVKLKYYGIYDKILPGGGSSRFWRFTLPGLGQIDFAGMIDELKKIGYDGVLSIEHEDRQYLGSDEKIAEGLELGRSFLAGLV